MRDDHGQQSRLKLRAACVRKAKLCSACVPIPLLFKYTYNSVQPAKCVEYGFVMFRSSGQLSFSPLSLLVGRWTLCASDEIVCLCICACGAVVSVLLKPPPPPHLLVRNLILLLLRAVAICCQIAAVCGIAAQATRLS
jgi:hypothetical protein